MLKPFVLLLVAVFCASCITANVCPPPIEFSPCRCDEVALRIWCENIPGRFDIKEIFDRVTPLMDTSTVFQELSIRSTSLFEIPAEAIPALKFKLITIDSNRGLDYISPLAFNATYAVTEEVSLWNNVLVNEAPKQRDIFEFFNKFEKVYSIWLPGNGITSIPENAFTQNPSLKDLYLGSNRIRSVGSFAFAQLTNLENLWLSSNSISPGGIAADSFTFLNNKVDIDLSFNDINYLEEFLFKPLLDTAAKVEVGGSTCGPSGCSYQYLACDSRADWLCHNSAEYESKLIGFRCPNSQPPSVWDYCDTIETSN